MHDPTPKEQRFSTAPLNAEAITARDELQSMSYQMIDWCLANPDQLTPAVSLASPKEGTIQLKIDVLGDHPEDEGQYMIVQRDELAALDNSDESPLKIARGFAAEEPNSWTNVNLLFPNSGRVRLETVTEKQIIKPPGIVLFTQIGSQVGKPAGAEDIKDVKKRLVSAAEAAGLPAELLA